MPKEARESFNWGWVLGTVGVGGALIALGIIGDLRWEWEPIISGTLTSVGATFLLAFVIFVMERRFTRTVTRRVEESTRAIVNEQTRVLSSRLGDLEAQLDERREAARAVHTEVIQAIVDDVSYDSITAGLQECQGSGAIGHGITVSASEDDPQLLVTIRWAPNIVSNGRGRFEPDGSGDHLTLTVVTDRRDGEIGAPVAETEWLPGLHPVDVADRMDTTLRQIGRLKEAKAWNLPHAVSSLVSALSLAMADQHAERGSERLRGQLLEALPGGWAITTEVLQNVDTGIQLTPADLGLRPGPQQSIRGFSTTPRPITTPPAPEGTDDRLWAFVFGRAVSHFREPLIL